MLIPCPTPESVVACPLSLRSSAVRFLFEDFSTETRSTASWHRTGHLGDTRRADAMVSGPTPVAEMVRTAQRLELAGADSLLLPRNLARAVDPPAGGEERRNIWARS